jgi:hypothetical protein
LTKITGIVSKWTQQSTTRLIETTKQWLQDANTRITLFYGLLPGATPQTPVRFVAVGDLGLARAMKNLTAIPRNCKSMKKFDDNSFASLA